MNNTNTALQKSTNALTLSAQLWFIVAVIGQLIFAYYIVVFYGGSVLQGKYEVLNASGGRAIGHIALVIHLFLAAIITIGGPLQLIPQVRSHFPIFHRWNGRVYLTGTLISIFAGLYMFTIRGSAGGIYVLIGFSISAALIVICTVMALRNALARDFKTHRRWALRLFILVSGTWFFRVGLMFWFGINQAPVGHTDAFDGPFDIFLSFAFFLFPLAILETYMSIKENGGALAQYIMASSLLLLTIAMGVGTAIAFMGMWLPRL